MNTYGPQIPIAVWADKEKYRQEGETFEQKCARVAQALSDSASHFDHCKDILKNQRFLPGGRVQSAAGSYREVTAFNCFVMKDVPDSLMGMMEVFKEAAKTMQLGGGVGYDFSGVRPRGDLIASLGSRSSGPVSFMQVPDAICKTIASAGHRRGAQMACLRVDHPDIMEFVSAKTNEHNLTQFNCSVLVTDEFMDAVKLNQPFDLKFKGKVYKTVNARALWDTILRNTWDWAEPGVLFIDRINEYNNLWYCEEIKATNPCGEQPLPPNGACLLGSFNLTKYVDFKTRSFLWDQLRHDIPAVVRMMDNIIDQTIYPLKEQEEEAKNKRRMGLGITGFANVCGLLGFKYGSEEANTFLDEVLCEIANGCYKSSVELAIEKGPFPLFDSEKYCQSKYIKHLDPDVQELIRKYGIRNSHLISIAPTGTISLTANNVSSGIEPVFSTSYVRKRQTFEGPVDEVVEDYAYREWGIECDTVQNVSVKDHVRTLCTAQYWVDSAVSKTCNVGDKVTWEQFKEVYLQAYDGGAKGCTTFRAAGKRFGILTSTASEDLVEDKDDHSEEFEVEGAACYIDPDTGIKSCDY